MQNKSQKLGVILLLALLTLGMGLASLCLGQYNVEFRSVVGVLARGLHLPGPDFSDAEQAIIWFVRLPRVLVALMVGGALAMSGAVMQGLFSNPLADPGIVGISAGASTGQTPAHVPQLMHADSSITKHKYLEN